MEKVTTLFELPNGWVWTKLSEITLPITRTSRTSEDSNQEFKYIDIEAIDNNSQTIKEVKTYTWGNAPSRAQQIVEIDDILFATVRPYLKNIAIVTNHHNKSIASSGFCILRPFIVNPKYVFYYILTQNFIDSVNLLAKGTSYPAVTNKIVLGQPIPLAMLDEQDQIVDKIEAFFGEFKDAEISLKKATKLLSVYEYVILKKAFEGKLTEYWRDNNPDNTAMVHLRKIAKKRKAEYDKAVINKNKVSSRQNNFDFEFSQNEEISSWAVAKLNKLIGISARVGWKGLKKEEYTSTGPLFISVHSLNHGKSVKFEDAYHISELRYEESPEIMLQQDDILLCKDGAGIGKIGIVKHLPSKATVNSSILIIRGGDAFNPDFLYYLFKGPQMQRLVNDRISGSAIPHLFQKDIKEFLLNVPPIEEQKQIVQEIESRFAIVKNLKSVIRDNQSRSEILKQIILNKAFSGKLTDQEEAFDVKTDLLEKIKLEKSSYIEAQRQLAKLIPKTIRTMEEKKSILQVLESTDVPISAKEVWLQSKHKDDIESFYSELREIQNKVIEIKKDTESLLSLRHEN